MLSHGASKVKYPISVLTAAIPRVPVIVSSETETLNHSASAIAA